MADVLTIEDDDGFVTRWPWPKGRLILSSAEFVTLCEQQHDALRRASSQTKEEPVSAPTKDTP